MDEILSYFFSVSDFFKFSLLSISFSDMFSGISHFLESWLQSSNYKLFVTLVTPIIWIYGSEVFVDSLKHAFITKFNEMPASIYRSFTESLFSDYLGTKKDSKRENSFGMSSEVSRQMEFVAIPLVCLILRVAIQTLELVGIYEWVSSFEFWQNLLRKANWLSFLGPVDTINIGMYKIVIITGFALIVYIWCMVLKLALGLFLLSRAKNVLRIH